MAQNKYFNIQILRNGEDITRYCSPDKFIALDRNLDATQIFSKIKLKITLLAGFAFTIKETDLFYIKVEECANYYFPTEIKQTSTNLEVQLSNVFELLKDKKFYVGEEGSEVLNPLLADFVDESEQITSPNLNTLLQMICRIAINGLTSFVLYSADTRDYNFATETESTIANFGALITYNANIASWGKDITPSEMLKNLQLEYCFQLIADNTYNDGFLTVSLPVMKISTDYTIPTSARLEMPEFFRIDTINKLLNPVKQLNKDYYSERPVLITIRKNGIIIKDDASPENIAFNFEYRNDIETEEVVYPENLNLNIHTTPLKIQFDGTNYILKAGYYHAYHYYFSYTDIVQDQSFKLDYQIPIGYQKADYKFTNETGEEDFTYPDSARKCVFDNENFAVILTDNKIIDKNNIRG